MEAWERGYSTWMVKAKLRKACKHGTETTSLLTGIHYIFQTITYEDITFTENLQEMNWCYHHLLRVLTYIGIPSIQLTRELRDGATSCEFHCHISQSMCDPSVDEMHCTCCGATGYYHFPPQHSPVVFAVLGHHTDYVCTRSYTGECNTATGTYMERM